MPTYADVAELRGVRPGAAADIEHALDLGVPQEAADRRELLALERQLPDPVDGAQIPQPFDHGRHRTSKLPTSR